MLDKLFSSKTRVAILKLFLFNPENSFYQRQISLLIHHSIRGVQREVERLQKFGLIEKSVQGNRVYYKANRNCPIFEEMKRIFFKSEGIAEIIKNNLAKADTIKIAFIYGSYAGSQESISSDIDLLFIGSITSRKVSSLLSRSKKELNREINYALFNSEEFKKRVKQKDHFLNNVLREKKIFIIGNEDELKRIAKSR